VPLISTTFFYYESVITAALDALFARYYPGEPIRKNETDGTVGTYGQRSGTCVRDTVKMGVLTL
jgi:hypothetical protein